MATGDKIYANSNRGLYFAIFLFLIVSGITGYFYYTNNYVLNKQVSEVEEQLKDSEKKMESLKKQRDLQVYHLLKKNYKIFELKEKYSNIPVLINKMKKFEKDYGIILKNFNYDKGKIKLQAQAYDSSSEKAYEKVNNFVGYFRNKNTIEGEEAHKKEFKLAFIKTFDGQKTDSIKFNIDLEIDPKNYKVEKIENFTSTENNNSGEQKEIDMSKIKEKLKKIKAKNYKNKTENGSGNIEN